jgi:hypothetical protein
MSDEQPKLQLYVVGESSGNPDDWSEYGSRMIVIAAGKEEACKLAECPQCTVTSLIDLTNPVILADQFYTGD